MKSLVLTFGVLFLAIGSQAKTIDKIVATVNNEIILQSDLSRLAKRASKPGQLEDILLEGKAASSLKKDQLQQLQYLINEKLLDSEVKKQGLTASPERVTQEIKQMAQRYHATPDEIVSAAKKELGFSSDDYRKFLKTQIERQSLIEQDVTSKIRVSDEEVFEEYQKRNPRSGVNVSEVTLAQIYFNPKKGGEDRAESRAEAALSKLRSGQSFDSVAEQTSEDPNFSNGGTLGSFKISDLNTDFQQAVQNLKIGQISGVVKSNNGLYILKVLDLKTIVDPQYEKNKEKIRSYLMERSFEKQFQSWLKGKREEATITISEPK